MRFRDDDRAVTVQIGAVLLFATLIIALSLYQATVVPSQNADVEYKHSQTTQDQLTDVRNGILRSAATGTTQPASVTLGTQYPSRVFLMNPPPSTGTLSTTDSGEIRLRNIAARNSETNDFFESEGFTWNSPTKALSYEPDYNEYDNAPTLLYESSILSNYYPNSEGEPAVPLSEQLLVNEDSKTITLVALNGSLSTTRADSASVEPEALSAPYQSIPVEPESGDTMTLTVPTRVSNETLATRTSLTAENVSAGPTPNTVNVTLTGDYTLRTAKVGIGSGATEPGVRYLTTNRNDRTVRSGETFTVTVRDAFNNPVDGGVEVSLNTSAVEGPQSKPVSDDGIATFTYTGGNQDFNATIPGGNDEHEVVFEGRAVTGGGGGGGGGGGNSGGPRVTAAGVSPDPVSAGAAVDLSATVNDTGLGGIDIAGAEWFRANPNETIEGVDPGTGNGNTMSFVDRKYYAIEDFTDSADTSGWQTGEHTIAFRGQDANGSWGLTERQTVNVTEGAPSVGIDVRLDDLTHNNENAVEYVGSYSVTNANSSFERVEVQYQGGESQTLQKAAERGGLRYTSGYGAGDTYDVTFSVIYSGPDGEYTAASRTITDVADAANPSENNNDLSTDSTAAFSSSTITDRSNSGQEPRYRLDYGVSAGGYSQTRFVAVATVSGGKDSTTGTARSGTLDVSPGYGTNQPFKLAVLVYGPDGAVVDARLVEDTADGADP